MSHFRPFPVSLCPVFYNQVADVVDYGTERLRMPFVFQSLLKVVPLFRPRSSRLQGYLGSPRHWTHYSA